MNDPILIDLPERIVGPRVSLRPYREGDGKALFAAVQASYEHLRPTMSWVVNHQTPEGSEAVARRCRVRWLAREGLTVGIWHGSRLIGGSGLHRIDWSRRRFEIGYWVRAEEEGKGYITEAVTLLRDFAFASLAANRVAIECAATNKRSAAVAERTGFCSEGRLAANSLVDGTLVDTLVFGMNRTRWESLKG